MLRLSISIGLFILYGTVFIEHVMSHDGLQHYVSPETKHASRIRRFGFFPQLEELRQNFCHSSCKSANTMSYIFNLLCAAKCPELYLPHHTTTESTTAESISTTPTPEITTGITPPAQGPNSMPQLPPEMGGMSQNGAASNTMPSTESSTDGTSQNGAASNTMPSSESSTDGMSQNGATSNTMPSSESDTSETSQNGAASNTMPSSESSAGGTS